MVGSMQRDHVVVEVGLPAGHDVDDDQADTVLEVARAPGGEGPTGFGAVLVGGGGELDGRDQAPAGLGVEDEELDDVGEDRRDLQVGGGRRPGRRAVSEFLGGKTSSRPPTWTWNSAK